VRLSVAAGLRSEDYQATVCGSGQDTLLLLDSGDFDAMMLDLRVPLVGRASLMSAPPTRPPR
jgi:DNA-binding response OmpR family regulator